MEACRCAANSCCVPKPSGPEEKLFRQGKWKVWVYDDGYSFGGPEGFSAVYPGKSAEHIDEEILQYHVSAWPGAVTEALPGMFLPTKLVRDLERYVRANYEWEE